MTAAQTNSNHHHPDNADLHCHTTASDGDLSPSAVVDRAVENGVDLLAITDHDNFDGLEEAQGAAAGRIKLISGIEFSCVWNGVDIHVVGLDFDPLRLQEAVIRQKQARENRTAKIAQRLEKQGVKNALQGAQRFATGEAIGRPHFAKFLISEGYFDSEAQAFNKWLGKSKIGNVNTCWPDMQTVVNDITIAGGHAVLAHPHKYKMTNTKLGRLLTDLKQCGGIGIEVCTSGINPQKREYFASLCERFELMASRGSDFHSPTNQWIELGKIAPLPDGVTPIWKLFR